MSQSKPSKQRLTNIPPVTFSDLPPKPYLAPVPYVSPDDVPTTNRPGHPRGETPQASYAFHLYAALPPAERTYDRVFEILVFEGKLKPTSKRLIEKWGSRWKWRERVKVIDAMRLEERHKEWEAARIKYHEDIADATGRAFDQVARFLEDRLASGRMNTEAAVQLYKIAADLKHRAYQELTERQRTSANTGIQIVIETDTGAAPTPGVTVNAQAKVIDLTPRPMPRPTLLEGPDGEAYPWDDDLPVAPQQGQYRDAEETPSAHVSDDQDDDPTA